MTTALEKAARAAWAKKFGVPFTALNEAQWADVFRDEWMSVIQAAFEAIQPIGAPFAGKAGIAAIIHDIVDSDLDGNLVHVDKAADAILAMLAASPQGEDRWITHDGGPNPVPGKMVECRLAALGIPDLPPIQSEYINWGNHIGPANIIAYRVTEGVKP